MSIVSLGIAVAALATSVHSCQQSNESIAIAKADFESDRLAVWGVDIRGDSALVVSLNEGVSLLRGFVYYPPGSGVAASPIGPPDHEFSIFAAQAAIRLQIERSVSPRPGSTLYGPVHAMPVVLQTRYVSRGEAYEDLSLYYLEFDFERNEQRAAVSIHGLQYGRRLPRDTDVSSLLDTEWNAMQ